MVTTLKQRHKPALTLDQRIASALADDTLTSSDLVALIRQAEAAAAKAREAAKAESERALDPANLDAEKSRAMAEKVRFEHERLSRAIPALTEQYRQAQALTALLIETAQLGTRLVTLLRRSRCACRCNAEAPRHEVSDPNENADLCTVSASTCCVGN